MDLADFTHMLAALFVLRNCTLDDIRECLAKHTRQSAAKAGQSLGHHKCRAKGIGIWAFTTRCQRSPFFFQKTVASLQSKQVLSLLSLSLSFLNSTSRLIRRPLKRLRTSIVDWFIPSGPTGMDPSQTAFFQALDVDHWPYGLKGVAACRQGVQGMLAPGPGVLP